MQNEEDKFLQKVSWRRVIVVHALTFSIANPKLMNDLHRLDRRDVFHGRHIVSGPPPRLHPEGLGHLHRLLLRGGELSGAGVGIHGEAHAVQQGPGLIVLQLLVH